MSPQKQQLNVTLETAGQHTLKWGAMDLATSAGKVVGFGAGECNLYLYPTCTISGVSERLSGDKLTALNELVVSLATDAGNDLMLTPDAVGAYPIHALLVANSQESIALAMKLFKAEPGLMLQTHGPGPFIGENCMHCLTVNSHEKELCECIDLAMARLPRDSVEILLTAQAEGVFFNDMPMRFYGGTPLGYAAVFCLKGAVKKMLETELVSLDAPAARCEVSGFLPIHAVTANGLKDMYDWLTSGVAKKQGEPALSRKLLADPMTVVSVGRLANLGVASCSPMQLAAQLGNKAFFIFVLRKQTTILWKWGPVTQYLIDLDGVDSAGDAECDVMEIIGRLDCHKETTEMLLDQFMQGFIHKLFVQKWARYGRPIHYCKMIVSVIYTLTLATVAFGLKEHPTKTHSQWHLPLGILLTLGILFVEELRTFSLWWENEGSGKNKWEKLATGFQWISSFQGEMQMGGYIVAAVACVLLLTANGAVLEPAAYLHAAGPDAAAVEPLAAPAPPPAPTLAAVAGRLLKVGGGAEQSYSAAMTPEEEEAYYAANDSSWAGEGANGLVLLLLAVALGAKAYWLTFNALTPSQRLGVFMLSVNRMLRNDILIFMVLFTLFVANFYCMLYIVYPRAGDEQLPEASQFNDWMAALQAMVTLAFMGEPIDFDVASVNMDMLNVWQKVDIYVFVVFYVFYVLMSIILLLNLLIAMLGNTFHTVYEASTLEWRLMFARYVLRLELLARPLNRWDLRVGDKSIDGKKYHFAFRDVAANAEGGGASGNPFEDTDVDILDEDEEAAAERKRDLHTEMLLQKIDAKLAGGGGTGGGGTGGGGTGGGGTGISPSQPRSSAAGAGGEQLEKLLASQAEMARQLNKLTGMVERLTVATPPRSAAD